MSIQKILGILLLLVGAVYGIVILSANVRNREVFRSENGRVSVLCILEGLVYFCATLGISDFLLNTLVFRHLRLAEDKKLPGTLCAACLTLPAMADVLPHGGVAIAGGLLLILAGIAAIAAAIIIAVIRRHKK